MSEAKKEREGVISQGIKTPIIQKGDDLQEIVISSVAKANDGQFDNGDIIAITEAVVAISQGNFVTHKNISDDIERKFLGAKELVIVDPIHSKVRFLEILKAISAVPTLKRIYIALTYPTDEVGNRLVSDMAILKKGINIYKKVYKMNEFYAEFGFTKNPYIGNDYVQECLYACNGEYTRKRSDEGKATILLCNDFSRLPSITKCKNFLVCSIDSERKRCTKKALKIGGAKKVLDLSQIMDQSIDGSGYNKEFGLYGCDLMSGNRLKLLPRDCQEFVEEIEEKIRKRYGKIVEVMVYGDGAFKDPDEGIWALADPKSTLASTDGRIYKEVKLNNIANEDEVTEFAYGGITPQRKICNQVASLADLTAGNGDRQTPVVYIKNYL